MSGFVLANCISFCRMQAFHLENKFVLLSVPQVQKTLEIQNVKKKSIAICLSLLKIVTLPLAWILCSTSELCSCPTMHICLLPSLMFQLSHIFPPHLIPPQSILCTAYIHRNCPGLYLLLQLLSFLFFPLPLNSSFLRVQLL